MLKVLGSVVAGLNDLAFDTVGYFWMLSNCVASAAYVVKESKQICIADILV